MVRARPVSVADCVLARALILHRTRARAPRPRFALPFVREPERDPLFGPYFQVRAFPAASPRPLSSASHARRPRLFPARARAAAAQMGRGAPRVAVQFSRGRARAPSSPSKIPAVLSARSDLSSRRETRCLSQTIFRATPLPELLLLERFRRSTSQRALVGEVRSMERALAELPLLYNHLTPLSFAAARRSSKRRGDARGARGMRPKKTARARSPRGHPLRAFCVRAELKRARDRARRRAPSPGHARAAVGTKGRFPSTAGGDGRAVRRGATRGSRDARIRARMGSHGAVYRASWHRMETRRPRHDD